MGLDISIRYRKIGSKPICEDEWGNQIFADGMIQKSIHSFEGRTEFAVVREWVGQERYGKFITLDKKNYASLINVIEKELNRDRAVENEEDEDPTFPGYLDYNDDFGLMSLYLLLLRAPLFVHKGWFMELECDW